MGIEPILYSGTSKDAFYRALRYIHEALLRPVQV
jgi:hypothetical protein